MTRSVSAVALQCSCIWLAQIPGRRVGSSRRNSAHLEYVHPASQLRETVPRRCSFPNQVSSGDVYSGHHRTYEMTPAIPHDGYLADFLMRNKGFIRD